MSSDVSRLIDDPRPYEDLIEINTCAFVLAEGVTVLYLLQDHLDGTLPTVVGKFVMQHAVALDITAAAVAHARILADAKVVTAAAMQAMLSAELRPGCTGTLVGEWPSATALDRKLAS